MRFFLQLTLLVIALTWSTGTLAQSSLKKADKQYEQHNYEAAIKFYEKLLKKKPEHPEALNRIADSYRRLNDLTKAAEYYKRAVNVSKPVKEAHKNYSRVLQSLGQYRDAKSQATLHALTDKDIAAQMLRSIVFAEKNRNNPPSAEINNEFINTAGDEFGATLFGSRVVYTSTRQDLIRKDNKNAKKKDIEGNPNQLFITERDGSGFLRTPAFLHSDLTNQYMQGPVAYSPDGKWVAYTVNNFREGTRHLPDGGMQLGLYIAAVENEGDFSAAAAFPYNGKTFSTGYPSWSEDGNTLYFASDRPDGFGGFDIYSSSRTGVSWTPPQNLGSTVNSKGNEISPYAEGNSLYFSSDLHEGYGGYDIFRAEKSGRRYTNIYHTGAGINTPFDDFGYVYDTKADLGYLTSNRQGGKGGYDLYRVKRLTRKVVVTVTDETGRPVEGATIDFSDCGEGVFLTDANGLYSFQVQPGLSCRPAVRKTGFRSSSFNLNDYSDSQKVTLRRGKGSDPVTDNNNSSNSGNNNSGTTRPGNNGNNRNNNNGNTGTGGSTRPVGEFLGFNGRVINERTGVGLPNVTIRARRQSDGMIMEATSDESGNYIIGLNPNTNYSVEYSKPNYFNASRSVRTGNTNDSSILGTTKINSTSGGYVGTGGGGTTGGGSDAVTYPGGGNNNNSGSTGGGYYPDSGSGSGGSGGYTGNTGGVSSGYAVQVAALSASGNADLSKFNNLADLGTVYYAPVGNVYKIRVGVYATAEQARAVAKSIQTRGYNGAFMVTEGNVNIGTANPTSSGSGGYTNANTGGYTGGNTNTTPTGAGGRYVVRLGAYSNPQKSFDRDRVLDIGTIAEQYKGQFTIILLTGYSSLDQALRALSKAKQRGFTDACVAEDVNGVLVKVK